MGKAARNKRERRDREVEAQVAVADAASSRRLRASAFWITVALLAAAGLTTALLTRDDTTDRAADRAARAAPDFAAVTVAGPELSTWTSNDRDAATGDTVPSISGTGLDGKPLRLAPNDGVARVYVVFAHWCPHCQAEVPRIVTWARTHELPSHVQVVGISTSASKDQPNFPPAAWLARERWHYDTLVDDEVGTAASALGLEGFPFLVFVDMRGQVVRRFSGEMPIPQFGAAVAALAPDRLAAGAPH